MRKRVHFDISHGMTEVATAQKWNVSQSFIAQLKRRLRETGSRCNKSKRIPFKEKVW